jgi:type IV pilus assembly protein PilM
MKSEQKRVIGLDMGSSSIKLVELSSNAGCFELERLALVPLGQGELQDAVARALAMILGSESVQCKRVATSISGANVAVRVLRFPKLARGEIEGAVWYEGGQVIAFDIKDAYVDYSVLCEQEADEDGEKGRTDVLFVAANRQEVDWRTRLLRDSGLEPRFVGVDMLVLLDAALMEPGDEQTVAVLHVGASSTGIGVTQGGSTPFVRDLEIGGNAFTDVISESLGVPFSEAETTKVTGASWTDETERAVKDVANRLVGEIHRSMVYYQTRSHGARVEKVLLCGGSSRLRGLRPLVEESLGVPVEPWSPMRGVHVDGARFDLPSVEQLSPFVALATALAMRSEVA